MRGKIELSIVLPSFEEEENLRILLPKIREVITKIGCTFEILVVDTMLPMDKTKNVCKKNKAVYLNRKISYSWMQMALTHRKLFHGYIQKEITMMW